MKLVDLEFTPHPLLGHPEQTEWFARLRRTLPACERWTEEQINEPVKTASATFPNGWTVRVLANMLGTHPTANWQVAWVIMCDGEECFRDVDWVSLDTPAAVDAALALTELLPNADTTPLDELRALREQLVMIGD